MLWIQKRYFSIGENFLHASSYSSSTNYSTMAEFRIQLKCEKNSENILQFVKECCKFRGEYASITISWFFLQWRSLHHVYGHYSNRKATLPAETRSKTRWAKCILISTITIPQHTTHTTHHHHHHTSPTPTTHHTSKNHPHPHQHISIYEKTANRRWRDLKTFERQCFLPQKAFSWRSRSRGRLMDSVYRVV